MTSLPTAQGNTALSPEWDRWFDEAFIDLVTSDEDLVRDEFDALIDASWEEPPPPVPPAPSEPAPPPDPTTAAITRPRTSTRRVRGRTPDTTANQRSPPG